jgi:hypothetical protein
MERDSEINPRTAAMLALLAIEQVIRIISIKFLLSTNSI